MPSDHSGRTGQFEREDLVRALQARERFLTDVIGSLESFVTIDEEWRLTYVNTAAERTLGLSSEELLGEDVRDLTPRTVLEEALPSLEQAMRDKVVVEFDASDAKNAIFLRARAYPLADGGLAVYVRDVTGQVQAERVRRESEEALAESEERYRQLFQAESDAILLIDQESGRVLEANAAAEAVYGYSAEEFLALTALELSAEPELSRVGSRAAVPGETLTVTRRKHRRKDGSAFPVEITGRTFDLRGRQVRIAAVRDMSERRAAKRRCAAARSSTGSSSRRPRRASSSGRRTATSPSSTRAWPTCSATPWTSCGAGPAWTSRSRARSPRCTRPGPSSARAEC